MCSISLQTVHVKQAMTALEYDVCTRVFFTNMFDKRVVIFNQLRRIAQVTRVGVIR